MFEKLRHDWTDTSRGLRAEYSKLIADDKVVLEKYQQSVLTSGQTLTNEVLATQQKIVLVENGVAQINAQYAHTQRELTNLQVATQCGAYKGSGDVGYRQNGKTKIMERRMLESIKNFCDRTKSEVGCVISSGS